MIDFFLALFASMGLSHIIVDSALFNPLKRKLEEWRNRKGKLANFWGGVLDMSNCYQCSGVWAGWLVGLLTMFSGSSLLNAFLLGFVNAVFSPLSTVIITFFNLKNTEMLERSLNETEETNAS